MTVIEKVIDKKVITILVIDSEEKGCKQCMFKDECTNPPVNRIMPCLSIDRKGGKSVYYQRLKVK